MMLYRKPEILSMAFPHFFKREIRLSLYCYLTFVKCSFRFGAGGKEYTAT